MRLGFHAATSMPSDLETDVVTIAHAGFRALEMWADKIDKYLVDHSLDELKALLAENDLAPMTINSIENISFRGDEYRQIQARCRQLCRWSQAIGCPTIILVPSPAPSRETTWEQVVAEHVNVLRDLSDIAAEYGVRLGFEFLHFAWCSVRTVRGAWEIVQKTGRENVGVVIDCSHVYGGGGLISEIDAVDPARILAFHLDDLEDGPKEAITLARRLLPGLGVIPLADIFERLQKLGYNGDCSVELFRPEYWAWDPKELAIRVRNSAMAILSPYFEVE